MYKVYTTKIHKFLMGKTKIHKFMGGRWRYKLIISLTFAKHTIYNVIRPSTQTYLSIYMWAYNSRINENSSLANVPVIVGMTLAMMTSLVRLI